MHKCPHEAFRQKRQVSKKQRSRHSDDEFRQDPKDLSNLEVDFHLQKDAEDHPYRPAIPHIPKREGDRLCLKFKGPHNGEF